jgi:type I restriction enzyme S subunit
MDLSRIYDTKLHVTEEAVEAGSRMVSAGAILAVVRGMSLAKDFRVARVMRDVAFNQDLKAIEPDATLDSKFLYWMLSSKRNFIRDHATEASHGTKKLELDVLESLAIPRPPLPIQRRIAEILSAYDDLIANNQRRMKLLEDSARLLYEEWFVRLRFPGHEHKIVDGVPEGWSKTSIDAVTSFLGRGISPAYDEAGKSMVINQKCIRERRLDLGPARRQAKEFKPDRQIQVGDVLVNSTGEGTLGRVSQVFVPIPECTVDSHVTIVRPKPEISRYVFGQMMMSLDAVFPTMGRGATNQKELGRDQIGEMTFFLPSSKVSTEFDSFAEPLYLNVCRLQEQSQKLRAARDLLLPRLMNGEIEV